LKTSEFLDENGSEMCRVFMISLTRHHAFMADDKCDVASLILH